MFPDRRGHQRVPGVGRGRGGRGEARARTARRRRPVKVGHHENHNSSNDILIHLRPGYR